MPGQLTSYRVQSFSDFNMHFVDHAREEEEEEEEEEEVEEEDEYFCT